MQKITAFITMDIQAYWACRQMMLLDHYCFKFFVFLNYYEMSVRLYCVMYM